jgi:hypothetical protein
MNPTTAQIIAWLTGRLAGWLTPIILAGLSWLIVQATTHLPFLAEPLSTVDQVAVTATLVAIIMAGINALTNKYLTAGTKQVQETVNKLIPQNIRPLELDGVAGPRTLAKLATVVKPVDTKPTP